MILLGQREELRRLRRAIGDLGLEPLDGDLLTEGADLLDFVGIDRIVDLEVRDLEQSHRPLGLVEGLAGPAAGAGRDQHAVLLLVLLDGDIERIDAGGLEQTHLADTGRRVLDLAERIGEAHDAEGILREDVEDGHCGSFRGDARRRRTVSGR